MEKWAVKIQESSLTFPQSGQLFQWVSQTYANGKSLIGVTEKPEQQSCSKYSGNFWYFTSFFSPQRGIEIKRRVYTSCFTHFRTDSSVAALSELNSSMARFQKWQSKNTNKVEYTQNMKHFPNAFDNPIIPVTATKVNVTKKLLACNMCEKA